MDKRFELVIVALVFVAVFIGAAIKVLSGGLFDYMFAAALLSPFVFILFLHLRSVWHIIVPILLVSGRLTLPLRGLSSLTPIILFSAMLLAVYIVDAAVYNDSYRRKFNWEDKFALLIAIIISLRFLYDRPGFVAFGAREGGLTLSLEYVLGAWSYFAVRRVACIGRFSRKQLMRSAFIVFLLFVFAVIKTHLYSKALFVRAFGEQESWMLASMLSALVLTSPSRNLKMWKYTMVALAFLAMAAVATYRGRVVYMLASLWSIAYAARRLRKSFVVLTLVGVAGVSIAIQFSDHMPAGMTRFLSLFTSVHRVEAVGGGYGWGDSFRGGLYELAWDQIEQNPLFGKGFGLNVSEAIAILAVGKKGTTMMMMAAGGAYHNSIAALAVIAGLPLALLFSVVFVSIPVKFIAMLRSQAAGDFKTWAMVILGFYSALACMLLLNGGPREFFYAMVLTGYMRGMMFNDAVENSGSEGIDELQSI